MPILHNTYQGVAKWVPLNTINMNIYLFPTELEAKCFRALCPNAEVVISGVGMVATAAAIASIDRRKHLLANDVIVLAGIAGTYAGGVAVGDVVEVTSEVCTDLPERFRQTYHQKVYHTSLRRVCSNTVHACGCEPLNADIENMEGAALFAMSEVIGFRAVEIRAISNIVGDSFDKWAVDEAVMALAVELKKFDDEK